VQDTGSTIDSTVPDTGSPDTGTAPETGPTCTPATGCYIIPSGWTLVPFAQNQSSPCPSGYGSPANVVEGPIASSECACGTCMITTNPCPGPIAVDYDNHGGGSDGGAGSCGLPGAPAQMSNSPTSACGTDMYTGGAGLLSYDNFDFKYTPQPNGVGNGGVCSTPGSVSGPVQFASSDRVCTPNNGQSGNCTGNQCMPSYPSPYEVCIAQNGNQICPAPFTAQHLVGTGLSTYTCSSCPCSVAADCTEGTLKLFTDNKCKNGEFDISANGTCEYPNPPSNSYQSYIYEPNGVACNITGTSTAQGASLNNEQTICCAN
jgi:hypothetical protein